MGKGLSEFQAITALYEVSRAVTSSLDLREVVSKTLRALADEMEIERGMLALRDPDTGQASIEAAHGLTEAEIRRGRYREGEGVVGRVLQTGEPMIVPNVGQEPLFLNRTRSRGDLTRAQISFICVPVMVGDETVGALSVDRVFRGSVDFEEDVRLLTIVAGYVAQAVRIHRMVESEKASLADVNLHLRRALEGEYRLENLIGASRPMQAVFEQALLVAKSRATVLITGESGTGKELVAKAVHYNSERSDEPFIGVSCASLPEAVLENELFGHERGAFTGATALKKGRFELAHGGTLFLDEVGEIPLNIQVKLLRVLQEREIERLGGKETIKVDVRVIAATNRDLAAEMRAGNFREDLYYRLNVVPIHLPPLREREGDVALLAQHFLRKYCSENARELQPLSRELVAALARHDWPGNVRELENVIERMVVLAQGDQLTAADLPPELGGEVRPAAVQAAGLEEAVRAAAAPLFDDGEVEGNPSVFRSVVERVEDTLIEEALKRTGGVRLKAAKRLGINRNTLFAKLSRAGTSSGEK